MCVCVCVCVYIYIYIHIHTYIHTHTHTHTHCAQYEDADRAKEIKIWDNGEYHVPRKSFRLPFWPRVLQGGQQ
jgi:hypothetical protein